jgi:hypothetical protein
MTESERRNDEQATRIPSKLLEPAFERVVAAVQGVCGMWGD